MTDFREAEPAAFFRHWFDMYTMLAYSPLTWVCMEAREELKRLAGECYKSTKGE
jgi:hypothetical protein